MASEKDKEDIQDKTKKNPPDQKGKEYAENGDNFSGGHSDNQPLPNNPAKNAELTSPEEDEERPD